MDASGYEYKVTVPKMYNPPDSENEPRVRLYISKNGGGTVGRTYGGYWTWALEIDGKIVEGDDTIWTGMPKTHRQAAMICADFLADEREESDPLHDRFTLFAEPESD